jgi:plasmid maintenance system antidote protein VapI
MATVNDLIRRHREYRKTPQSAGMQLRIDLSGIIAKKLHEKRWTQKQLADAAGLKESQVTNLIHSNKNCTFDTAGRVLHALGVKVALRDKAELDAAVSAVAMANVSLISLTLHRARAPVTVVNTPSEVRYAAQAVQEASRPLFAPGRSIEYLPYDFGDELGKAGGIRPEGKSRLADSLG